MLVQSVSYHSDHKTYKLRNGKCILAHRYCCLGENDNAMVTPDGKMHAKCLNGRANVLPIYSKRDIIKVGERAIPLIIKEPVSEQELLGYHKLEDYHYRGKSIHGRRVPLIVVSNDPLLPVVLGYIELATAFMMNRPRAILFNHSFAEQKVKWESWDKEAMKNYTNIVVRVARCVISPEFRGLGLSGLLVKHAIEFARHHWHVANIKPLFLEITADMLRYVPFVETAGMHYIGETEGNLKRISKDMDYILANYKRVKSGEILDEQSAGIVDLQVHYATCLNQILRDYNLSKDDLLKLLMKSPQKLSDDNWALLHQIFRLPKPTFIIGLSRKAERFIKKRIKQLNLPQKFPAYFPANARGTIKKPIEVSNCSIHLDSLLMRTKNTRKVQHAFGVNKEMLRTVLFSNLNFDIKPGDIVLLCGPSGAGKTTLLSVLKHSFLSSRKISSLQSGHITSPRNVTVECLEPLRNAYPLVNSLGNVSFEHALYALNVSGLAEAHLYVRRFKELSNGQRYRAMVAKLIASKADIWIADEFCATLDPITANIVSRNLRRCAKKLGVTVILAAANWSEFIHELQPDTVVHLRSPWEYKIFNWDEFQEAVARSHAIGNATEPLFNFRLK